MEHQGTFVRYGALNAMVEISHEKGSPYPPVWVHLQYVKPAGGKGSRRAATKSGNLRELFLKKRKAQKQDTPASKKKYMKAAKPT